MQFTDALDPTRLPIVADRNTLAVIHRHYFGPISARSLERLPLPRRIVNGKAVYEVRSFIEWARARFNAAPVINGARKVGGR
ncbi:MAG: hypothetical protein FJX57_02565 [Alphaproteobacteria bacterium]|nr:hypothetical protein [Alphaproteobacteria bacterium]